MAYDDKTMMMDMLSTEKFLSANYNTFANECASKTSKAKMVKILNDEHDIQFDIFRAMSSKGWYQTTPATTEKINQAIQIHVGSATNVKQPEELKKKQTKSSKKSSK